MASKLSLFLAELKRRKVTRVAVVYALVGLGVIEGASMILPTLQLEAAQDYIVVLVLFGLPIALVLAWALEVTPQGIQKTADLTPEQLASQTPEKWRASSWVLAGAGFVAVLAAGYFVLLRGPSEPTLPEDYVAVFPFTNLTGDPALDDLGPYAAYSITEGLSRAPEVRQVASTTVEQAFAGRGEGATALETARDLKAGIAVTGVYTIQGSSLDFHAEITRVTNGELVTSVEASGPSDNPSEAINDLRDRVMGALAASLYETVDLIAASPAPNYGAFLAYRRGNSVFRSGDWMAALPYFEEAFRLDSTFLAATSGIATVFLNTGQLQRLDSLVTWVQERRSQLPPQSLLLLDYGLAQVAGDREKVLQIMRELFRTDPTTNAYQMAEEALQAGRPEEVLQALEHADPDAPFLRDWAPLWGRRAWANRILGRYREQLEAAREGKERFPQSLELRTHEVVALAAMGRLQEIELLLDQIERMERDGFGRTPGTVFMSLAADLARLEHSDEARTAAERSISWFRAHSQGEDPFELSQALLLADRPEEATEILGPLVESDPEDLDLRGLLGVCLASAGDTDGAEAIARWFEELDRPFLNGQDTYYRAAILAHLGQPEEATRLATQALREGRPYLYLVYPSPVLMPLWNYEPFQRLIAPKG